MALEEIHIIYHIVGFLQIIKNNIILHFLIETPISTSKKARLVANGLSSLIHGRDIVPELAECIDIASISLNAPTAKEYVDVTRPIYGEKAFDAMCDFAKRSHAAGIDTMFTVVDVIPKEQIEASKKLCEELGVPLRIREFVE